MSIPVEEDQVLDLYHRTSREAAEAIVRDGTLLSRENTAEAFASDRQSGYADEYGEAVVHVRIPESLATLEDDDELHYRIPLDQAEVVEAYTLTEDGSRSPIGVVQDDETATDTDGAADVVVGPVDADGADVELVDAEGNTVVVGAVSEDELRDALDSPDPAAALVAAAEENSEEAAAEEAAAADLEPDPAERVSDGLVTAGVVGVGAAVIAQGVASDVQDAVDAVEARLDLVAAAETPQVQAGTADELVESGTMERVEGLRQSLGVSRSQMTPQEIADADARSLIPTEDRVAGLRQEIIDNPAMTEAFEEPQSVRDQRELPSPTLAASGVQQTTPTTR